MYAKPYYYPGEGGILMWHADMVYLERFTGDELLVCNRFIAAVFFSCLFPPGSCSGVSLYNGEISSLFSLPFRHLGAYIC